MKEMETLVYDRPGAVVQDRIHERLPWGIRTPVYNKLFGGDLDHVWRTAFRTRKYLEDRKVMKPMDKLLVQDPPHAVYGRTYQETSSSLHFQIEEILLERLAAIYNIYITLRHSSFLHSSDDA